MELKLEIINRHISGKIPAGYSSVIDKLIINYL